MSFIGLCTGIQLTDYLEEQKRIKDSFTPKAHHSMGSSSQKRGTWSTVHSLWAAPQLESVPWRWLSLHFFQGTWLVPVAVLQLGPSESDSQLYLWEGRSLVNLVGFRKFLKLFRVAYFLSKELPCRGECFNTITNC